MKYPTESACHFIGVGGVVIHDGKVLLVKLTYGPAQGKWLIPGGLVDRGETLQEALIREIHEETNQAVVPESIIALRAMVRNTDNLTDLYVVFKCNLPADPAPLIKDDLEITRVKWMDIDILMTHPDVSPYTKKIVTRAQSDNSNLYFDEIWSTQSRQTNRFKKYEHFF